MARLNLKALKNVQHRVFTQNALLGIVVTLIILLLDWNGEDGVLSGIERPLFDERAKWCQHFQPEPTDNLLHLDITDSSLQHIGAWPWPRAKIARMLDEMHRAGAKAVAFDIIFAEPQNERYRPVGKRVLVNDNSSIFEGRFQRVIDDENFARSIGEFGAVILPASFHVKKPSTETESAALAEMKRDIFMSEQALRHALRQKDVDLPDPQTFHGIFQQSRRQALYQSIIESIDQQVAEAEHARPTKPTQPTNVVSNSAASPSSKSSQNDPSFIAAVNANQTSDNTNHAGDPANPTPPTTPAAQPAANPATPLPHEDGQPVDPMFYQVRDRVLPDIEKKYEHAHLREMFEKEYSKAVSFHHLRQFSRPSRPEYRATPVVGAHAPIPTLVKSQGAFGFIDNHLTDPDGKVRKLALFEEYDGRLYPNMSVALACAALNINIEDVEIGEDEVIFPVPDGKPIKVPVFSHHVDSAGRECGLFTYFPWFGKPNVTNAWMYMYDRTDGEANEGHLPILKVWEIVELQDDKIASNTESLREALLSIFQVSDPDIVTRLEETNIPYENADGYLALLKSDWIVSKLDDAFFTYGELVEMTDAEFKEWNAEDPDPIRRLRTERMRAAMAVLPDLREQLTSINEELNRLRSNLRRKLYDKAILVGWTAEGRMDDVPTSIHPNVPGVVAHGVMFNAMMTGEFWERASPWLARFFTVVLGLLVTLAVAKLTPPKALAAALVLALAYVLFNGIVLFDLNNLVVGMAAPLMTIIVVWASGTMLRFIVERREKAFITRRFRSYVDPALVNFVMENPNRASFAGEVREMTVVFTDLQGFTSISEKLQEATVPLLNEYMERMVPIIRERNGYVNKFLGDGIMFFYGAPQVTETHAVDAVATAIRMQEAMAPFNDKLEADDLPSVVMRVGISTGSMVVGDAGSHDAADYTVLGDSVNFAARLESANKYLGTRMMISERTAELIGDEFLVRPLAKLQVVGKTQGMMAFEPLNFANEATDHQKQLAELTQRMFDHYRSADFDGCLETLIELDELAGASKLASLYREHCEQYLVTPPGEDFDGTIVLTSK